MAAAAAGDNNVEIPEYFVCPISLQIMKDPVTAVSGITYDRDSIERWLFKSHHAICPVTKQPLPENSDLTPNHTLRRLIQAWSTANQASGVDRIPTPKPPLSKLYFIKLVKDLTRRKLQTLEALAAESDRNRVLMVEAGIGAAVVDFIVDCYRNREADGGLEEALSLIYVIRGALKKSRAGAGAGELAGNLEIVDALIWGLGFDNLKSQAACALKIVVQAADGGAPARIFETMKAETLAGIGGNLVGGGISQQGVNSLLHVAVEACQWGRNRVRMVELGFVSDLIELELQCPARRTTELVLEVLYRLCSQAEGRAEFLRHAAAVAVVTRRMLTVSAAADERAVMILWVVSKFSGTAAVAEEMVRVRTAAKLCAVMQVECGWHVKEKSREILRRHFQAWKDSPCVEVATLARYTTT
ncbi:E3 ubiquitin-protein ligase PUB24-like [Andrographis paniculata]|uniref:E3 ubiquitin-protein ligase PUB24-like n=1 Tax=Andrographis paniculata TaxID=175694 RepID=UPI0021E711E8|nr:E3 ubiquitin-protein ligase PUB24-like [Andrographis paniculata]